MERKTHFCTRSLTSLNHELFLKQHGDICLNKVIEGNLIDSSKSTAGYSEEIRSRFVNKQYGGDEASKRGQR